MDSSIPHSCPTITNDIKAELCDVLDKKMIASGNKLENFELSLLSYLSRQYLKFYSSGTSAMYWGLKSLGLRPFDEVLIPTYICESVLNAVIMADLTPVLYDNMAGSWCSSYEEIYKKITSRTKAVLINHVYGISFNYKCVLKLKELNLLLIEDCAHYISNKTSAIEHSNEFDISIYSFNATKLLTTGEGGAVVTNNEVYFNKLQDLHLDNGLSNLSAAIGLSQIKHFNDFLKKRKEIAKYYDSELNDYNVLRCEKESIYFRYPVMIEKENNLLGNSKVNFKKGVDELLHRKIGLSDVDYPNAVNTFNKTISLPIYPGLTEKKMQIVINEIKKIL